VAAGFEQAKTPAIVGAWTLDKELSDQPPSADRGSGDNGGNRRGGGGYGRGGGGFGGGFGGGRRGMGGRGGGGSTMSPEDAERMRQAMRDELTAPDQLTIVQSDAMIVITSQDGRTVRLSPDGKKVKEENTNVERKTKWDGDKLVCEVKGLGRGTITETYRVDPETHRLTVSIQMKGGRDNQERTFNHVNDPASKEG
jgi:hypothetical protein